MDWGREVKVQGVERVVRCALPAGVSVVLSLRRREMQFTERRWIRLRKLTATAHETSHAATVFVFQQLACRAFA